MTVTEALEWRRAVPSFDRQVEIPRGELLALMNKANLAPSSQNLQPWAFLICQTPSEKGRLQAVSYNQKKIGEASAVVVLLGELDHHLNADRVATSNIERGYFGEERRASFVESAHRAYASPQAVRDEMFRGGSLWAMAFMLVCAEAGWDATPMGGFEREPLIREFKLAENLLPVMLLAVGKRNPEVHLLPRNERIPVAEKLRPAS